MDTRVMRPCSIQDRPVQVRSRGKGAAQAVQGFIEDGKVIDRPTPMPELFNRARQDTREDLSSCLKSGE